MRWPLQPLQPFQQTQLQPPFGQSVASLCHPWFTTTNFSYKFPIFETSATALCGTTGILPGRLTNTWMPSLLASAHLLYWHPTQIHTIRALLCKFKLSLEGILSLRQRDLPDCRLDPETNSCQTGKENRDSSRNRRIFTYEIHLYYHHYYSQTSSSFELGGRDLWLMVLLLNLYFLTSFSVSFGSRHLSNLYSFIPWRTTLLTFHPGCFLHPTRRLLPIRLPHLHGLKIRHQHHIFLAWPEWFLTLPPFTLFSSRRSLTPSLLDLMNFGSWNGQKMVEKLGSRWKLFWRTFTSRVTGLHYAPCQPMATVLWCTRSFAFFIYGNILSCSSTSWTYQCTCLTTVWCHT